MNKKVNYGSLGINYAKQTVQKNDTIRLAVILIGVIVIGGVAFFGYRKYRVSREVAAQLDFGQGLREYMRGAVRETMWPEVQEIFKAGYDRNKSSSLAPYFRLFEANALIEQEKKEEALVIMNEALSMLSSSSPLYTMYATKRALLNIDLGKDDGLEQLKQLAHDEKNVQRDLSLYYLGLYYWSKNDIDAAQREWRLLISLKNNDPKATSEWINLAEKKLEQIV